MFPKLLILFVVLTWGPVSTYRETNRQAGEPAALCRTEPVDLTVDVSKIKNQDGKLTVCLYNNKDGFPTDPAKAALKQSVAISGSTAQVVFKNVPPGTYYLSVFHDANNNGKPDRNFMGLPKEGVGLANDDMKGMKPDFDKAFVQLKAGSQRVAIQLRYVL